jgi:hypothetical protein
MRDAKGIALRLSEIACEHDNKLLFSLISLHPAKKEFIND